MTRTMAQPANGRTAQREQESGLLDKVIDASTITYRPLGEGEDIKLNVGLVRKYLCVPTKDGHMPTDQDVMTFMMICRQRALNPWVSDCYLTGYDTRNGPKFSVIIAVQALFKRAEINEHFDGIESGVVVIEDGKLIDRPGDLVLPDENLIGGWARVWRKDKSHPFYQRLTVASRRKPSPFWENDPGGQVCKCAEAGALRQAFPSDVGGLYLREEMLETGLLAHGTPEPAKNLADLAMRIESPPTSQRQEQPEETHDRPQTTDEPDSEVIAGCKNTLPDANSIGDCEAIKATWLKNAKTEADRTAVTGLCEAREAEIRASRGANSNK